jgi:hypothetical protein
LSSDVNVCVEKVIKEFNYFNELIKIWDCMLVGG